MRFDDQRESDNIEDQRGNSGGGGLGFGGGGGGGLIGMLLPLVASRLGCGGVAVLVVLFLVFGGGLGSLGGLIGGGGSVGGAPQIGQASVPATAPGAAPSASAETTTDRFVRKVLGSTEDVWTQLFPTQAGKQYTPPRLVLFNGRYNGGGCGAAESAMGPFYCPSDGKVYLDESFFDELKQRFGAPGDAAAAYVVAHEIGHHIQRLLGVTDQVEAAQARASRSQRNALSVRLELQADCFAGVWAKASGRLEAGDIEEAVTAAQAIGDDTLQRQARGTVVPDSFTHGSSAQRIQWLRTGLASGNMASCDTFQGA